MAGRPALTAPMICAGGRLVAAAQQYDAVERLRADHLLDVHGHEVAQQHRGGLDEHLAQADGGEFERNAAGDPDAALDRVGDGLQMEVAVVQLAPGIGNADDGLTFVEDGGREAFRAQPGAAGESVVLARLEPLGGAGVNSLDFARGEHSVYFSIIDAAHSAVGFGPVPVRRDRAPVR